MEELTMMNEGMEASHFDYTGVKKPNFDQAGKDIVTAVILLGIAGAGYWVGRNVVEPLVVKVTNAIVAEFKKNKVKEVEDPNEE